MKWWAFVSVHLEEARALGHLLVVAVNSDDSVSRLKGPTRPIVPCEQRMALLAGLECIDFVVSFDEDTPAEVISELVPDVLVKGADYKIEDIVGADTVQKAGGRVERIKFVDGLSTSNIISRVKSEQSSTIS